MSGIRRTEKKWVRSRAKGFEDLEVFKRAYRLSLDVHRWSLGLPRLEQFALGDQIRRSSKSVCANLAEGFGRQSESQADLRRFCLIAQSSADETRLWLRYALDLGYLEEAQWKRWRQGLRRRLVRLGSSDP